MRRALLPLLPLLLLPLLVAPAASADATPVVRLTLADSGRTVHVPVGTRVEVRLGDDETWNGVQTGTATLDLVRRSTDGGLSADLDAVAAQADPQHLTATTDLACFHAQHPCVPPQRLWDVGVVVDAPGTAPAAPACTPAARALPSAAPGVVLVSAADDGRTVQLPRDGRLYVLLDGCDDRWSPAGGSQTLFRSAADLDQARGTVSSVFTPAATGTATVTARTDPRCLHDGSGCDAAQRAFVLHVDVRDYSATCTQPASLGFVVAPGRVAAGDAVTASGGHRDPCADPASEPVHDFRLLATPQGGAESETSRQQAPYFSSGEVRPETTTTYRLLMDGSQVGAPQTVTVDRVSGSCAQGFGGPARVTAGSVAGLGGTARPGETVQVLFRRRGASAFAPGRTVVADADGRFRTTFTATDDLRHVARSARCDYAGGLTQAVPVVTGPAVVRRGTTVTLRVQAPVGVPTRVWFRGPGQVPTARRTLSGPGTVTYRAVTDERWYGTTPSVTGPAGLTQTR